MWHNQYFRVIKHVQTEAKFRNNLDTVQEDCQNIKGGQNLLWE